MHTKEGTVLELLTEVVSTSCVRLEEVLHTPASDASSIAAELEGVSADLKSTSARLAQLAAIIRAEMASRGD
jgi:hypothetical protein